MPMSVTTSIGLVGPERERHTAITHLFVNEDAVLVVAVVPAVELQCHRRGKRRAARGRSERP